MSPLRETVWRQLSVPALGKFGGRDAQHVLAQQQEHAEQEGTGEAALGDSDLWRLPIFRNVDNNGVAGISATGGQRDNQLSVLTLWAEEHVRRGERRPNTVLQPYLA